MRAVTFETKDAGGIMLSRVVELTIVDGKVTHSEPKTAFDIPAITISQCEHISTTHLLSALGYNDETIANASPTGREPAVELNEPSLDGGSSKASPSAKRKP